LALPWQHIYSIFRCTAPGKAVQITQRQEVTHKQRLAQISIIFMAPTFFASNRPCASKKAPARECSAGRMQIPFRSPD
jgi:hypothetical protein